MAVVIVTGSAGLVGSEAVRFYCGQGRQVVGIDNDLRSYFFGPEASTAANRDHLIETYANYRHHQADIRDDKAIGKVFAEFGRDIALVIHTASQPSHDWAAREPMTDFTVNANGTLVMLESARRHCPEAAFIFTSTNKVYGDAPNALPLVEQKKRWEIDATHRWAGGIDETMSIDQSKHSLFGASKVAGDVLVQEYGRYFGMPTACFRAGCITGPAHAGAKLHGFLSYLMKCVMTGTPYTVFGYKGKQVRDNIHAGDLVSAFDCFSKAPRPAGVYNIGGGRFSNCSMLEAIEISEAIAGRKLNWAYTDDNRIGDHIWWISGVGRFQSHYPDWRPKYDVGAILRQIHDNNRDRWRQGAKT